MRQNEWDRRVEGDAHLFGTEPNAFLTLQAFRLRPGMKVLAVADGEGRNGVWLAERGLDAVSMDASAVALAKARQLADRQGVALHTVQADIAEWSGDPTTSTSSWPSSCSSQDLRSRMFDGSIAA